MNASNSWHLLENGEVLRLLESDMYQGLSSAGAKKRRKKHGPNTVWHVRRTPALGVARIALFDLPTLLLVVSAAAAALFDRRFEAGMIASVLVLGALLRTAAAVRANRILEDMARERIPVSSVIRDGRIHLLPAGEIVQGDIIFLEPGDTVPCDGRVMTGEDAVVSERGITENSLPVHKFNTVIATDAQSGEIPCEFRSNMLFAGSLVLSGSVRIAATACGEDCLFSMKQGGITIEAEHNFPLIERLRKSSRTASLTMLAAVLVLTALSLFAGEIFTLPDVFLGTMAMAVAAMSEFLPAVALIIAAVTIRDAAAGHRPEKAGAALRRRLGSLAGKDVGPGDTAREKTGSRAIFRDPAKLEAVASPDAVVFCGSDYFKSGCAELLAFRAKGAYTGIDEAGGDPSELLAVSLAATTQTGRRTGVSGSSRQKQISHKAAGRAALVSLAADAWARKNGGSLPPAYPLADHRDSSDKLAMGMEISLAQIRGDLWAVACGALQDVLACCSAVETADGQIPLTDDYRKKCFSEAAALEFGGARVLAAARRISPYPQLNRLAVLTQAMSFVGFFAVAMEPEEAARENIDYLKQSGAVPILFTETPDEDRYYCHRIGLFGRETPVIPYAEWEASRIKALLEKQSGTAGGLIVSFEEIGDDYLGGAYVRAMTSLGAAGGDSVVAAVGREAWDAGALGRADLGFAAARGKYRAVPESLARNAAVVIHTAEGTQTGYGGLDGAVAAIRAARRALGNTAAAKFYLTASQAARFMLVLAAIFGLIPLISPVFILIWGLIFDFAAVLVTAFEHGVPFTENRVRDETAGTWKSVFRAAVSGVLWGAVLTAGAVLAGRLFSAVPFSAWTSGSTRALLSAAAILSGLAFAAECTVRGSLFARREFNLAQLIFTSLSLLFAAWTAFTGAGAASVGGAPCGPAGFAAAIPALLVLLIAEGLKWALRQWKRKKRKP